MLMSKEANMELWKEYSENKDTKSRDRLINTYYYLVNYTAIKIKYYLTSIYEYDEILSLGTLGLIDAIEKFDLKKEVKFQTYALIRIKGSIIDGIRKTGWLPLFKNKIENSKSMYSNFSIISINHEYFNQADLVCPEDFYSRELKIILRHHIRKLEKLQKTVIILYYFKDFSMKKIGQFMKVSESRVSQLHSKAIIKLRSSIEPLAEISSFYKML